MDSDQWISSLLAAKRQSSIQNHQNLTSDRLNVDEFELVVEEQPDLFCPYCYEDLDIESLRAHLEEDHPFESKGAVCPICSADVARDMLIHITVQHEPLFKAQKRKVLLKCDTTSDHGFSLLGSDLRDTYLQVLSGHKSNNYSASSKASDPFLSSLLINFPTYEVENPSKTSISKADESYTKRGSSIPHWKSSPESPMTLKEREEQLKLIIRRTNFVQEVVASAMFGDL